MDSQFEAPVEISPAGGLVEQGTQVSMTAPARFDVLYTTDGSDPRVAVAPSVQTYAEPITIDQNTQIVARGFDESREEWTGVTRVNFVVDTPTVVLSELNYNPYDPTEAERTVTKPFPYPTTGTYPEEVMRNIDVIEEVRPHPPSKTL